MRKERGKEKLTVVEMIIPRLNYTETIREMHAIAEARDHHHLYSCDYSTWFFFVLCLRFTLFPMRFLSFMLCAIVRVEISLRLFFSYLFSFSSCLFAQWRVCGAMKMKEKKKQDERSRGFFCFVTSRQAQQRIWSRNEMECKNLTLLITFQCFLIISSAAISLS